ncbi:hypothetical protein [Siccirubricoccus phaeus]|uniref:hypothetical protein n=1 Tax=Siccirubricoccus phaeus TaxID=2595053 RepID=UPI0011F0A05A|nr:hypothetical protein [Siccirubricoccus phaeus]
MRAALLAGWLLAAAALPAAAQQLTLQAADGREVVVTAAELAAMPHQQLRAPGRDPAFYEGVPLGLLLARLGVPQGEALRGRALALAVVVRAADGYAAVLALAEADAVTRDAPVILADRRADGPLAAEEAPFRLIVGGDRRPARSARQVVRIELRDLR